MYIYIYIYIYLSRWRVKIFCRCVCRPRVMFVKRSQPATWRHYHVGKRGTRAIRIRRWKKNSWIHRSSSLYIIRSNDKNSRTIDRVYIDAIVPWNIHRGNVQYLKAFKCMFCRNYVSHVSARPCAIRYVCAKIFSSAVRRIGRYRTAM